MILAGTDFMFSVVIAQRTWLILQLVEKNGIHCKANADNLTKRFHEYSRSGLLSALFFSAHCLFWSVAVATLSKKKKQKKKKKTMKVISICCNGNRNVENSCMFCQIGSL